MRVDGSGLKCLYRDCVTIFNFSDNQLFALTTDSTPEVPLSVDELSQQLVCMNPDGSKAVSYSLDNIDFTSLSYYDSHWSSYVYPSVLAISDSRVYFLIALAGNANILAYIDLDDSTAQPKLLWVHKTQILLFSVVKDYLCFWDLDAKISTWKLSISQALRLNDPLDELSEEKRQKLCTKVGDTSMMPVPAGDWLFVFQESGSYRMRLDGSGSTPI